MCYALFALLYMMNVKKDRQYDEMMFMISGLFLKIKGEERGTILSIYLQLILFSTIYFAYSV